MYTFNYTFVIVTNEDVLVDIDGEVLGEGFREVYKTYSHQSLLHPSYAKNLIERYRYLLP